MKQNNEVPARNNSGDDSSHWYFGVIYFNPKDKRIFPPKRWPIMGWTVNFANPVSIALFIVVLAVAITFNVYLSRR